MQQVADGLYRLGSKHHNFYVVRDGGKATIVDSGGSNDFPAMERGLGELGLGLADVEVLVITHAHTDHMGSGRRASKAGVSVKGHEAEVSVLSGVRPISQIKPTHPALLKPAVWPFVVAMLRAGATGAAPIPDVEAVADGEVLDVPGRPRVVQRRVILPVTRPTTWRSVGSCSAGTHSARGTRSGDRPGHSYWLHRFTPMLSSPAGRWLGWMRSRPTWCSPATAPRGEDLRPGRWG